MDEFLDLFDNLKIDKETAAATNDNPLKMATNVTPAVPVSSTTKNTL